MNKRPKPFDWIYIPIMHIIIDENLIWRKKKTVFAKSRKKLCHFTVRFLMGEVAIVYYPFMQYLCSIKMQQMDYVRKSICHLFVFLFFVVSYPFFAFWLLLIVACELCTYSVYFLLYLWFEREFMLCCRGTKDMQQL